MCCLTRIASIREAERGLLRVVVFNTFCIEPHYKFVLQNLLRKIYLLENFQERCEHRRGPAMTWPRTF